MLKKLPLLCFKKSRCITNELVHRSVTYVHCKKFQNQVLSYFEKSEDNSPELSKEPYFKNGKIQLYRDDIPKIHNIALKVKGENVNKKLEAIFQIIDKMSSEQDPEIKKEHMDDLDIKCFAIINYLQPSEILRLMNSFFKIIPDEFQTSYFYDKALINLVNFGKNQLLTEHEIIQLLWFISLNGEKYGKYMAALDPYIPDINKLPLMEQCILVQAFYNTSMKITLQQTKVISRTLERDFRQLMSHPNYLIILCKALAISETSENVSLDNVSKNILELDRPIHFLISTYLLNLYAVTHTQEESVTDKLVEECFDRLKEDMKSKLFSIPLVHVEKFLWSLSILGIHLTLNEKSITQAYLEQRYAEFRSSSENLAYLLNSVLSTIILRCWNTKLLRQCLEDKVFFQFLENSSRWKMEPQVQLLLTLLSTEMKMTSFIPKKFLKKTNFTYTVSENMHIVSYIADDLAKKKVIRHVALECPITCIKIPGVTFSTAVETFHLDVLDDLTCFKKTTEPHGLTKLKFRLLSRLGYRLIQIDGSIFKNKPDQIKSYIEKQIVNRINNFNEWRVYEKETEQKENVDKNV